jgi:hypothetical protein
MVGVVRKSDEKAHRKGETNQGNERCDAPAAGPGITEPCLEDEIEREGECPCNKTQGEGIVLHESKLENLHDAPARMAEFSRIAFP